MRSNSIPLQRAGRRPAALVDPGAGARLYTRQVSEVNMNDSSLSLITPAVAARAHCSVEVVRTSVSAEKE